MNNFMLTDRPLHPLAKKVAKHFRQGGMKRREFLANMAGLGVSGIGAFTLGGISPAAVQVEADRTKGGVLRIAQNVVPFKDPRMFDWIELANIGAACNEYLVRWDNDSSFTPWLMERWETNDDASVYTLHLSTRFT